MQNARIEDFRPRRKNENHVRWCEKDVCLIDYFSLSKSFDTVFSIVYLFSNLGAQKKTENETKSPTTTTTCVIFSFLSLL